MKRSGLLNLFILSLFFFCVSFIFPVSSESVERQRELEKLAALTSPEERQQAVKAAFLHAWNGYVNFAWDHDELRPISKTKHNWMNLGLTIVDSLDTLHIMGLENSFQKAKEWVRDKLNWNRAVGHLSFFETTIRILGGLLAAYEMDGDYLFLKKAKELGDMLLVSFDSPNGLPFPSFSTSNSSRAYGTTALLAEVGTVQMEFVTLSKHTGNPIYAKKALHVYDHCEKYCPEPKGLYPIHVSLTHNGLSGPVTLGGMGDSYFEYLLKMYLLTDKKIERFSRLYNQSYEAIKRSGMIASGGGHKYLATYYGRGSVSNQMEHLACFAGGMFALGGDLELGHEIAKTCYEMYRATASGIGQESMAFDGTGPKPGHGSLAYYLRPEAIETIFVMWRLTHKPIYREMGWKMFLAIEKHCKTTYGYTGLRDANNPNPVGDDLQQSFFLAETLKYFYLLFSPDTLIPLDKYVFNTEAHPLKIYKDPLYVWESIFDGFK